MNFLKYKFTNIKGSALAEFFLASLSIFLFAIILLPIISDLKSSRDKVEIINNLKLIKVYSEKYFEENVTDSVNLYEIVGPRKAIPKLTIILDEVYPEKIYRGEYIFVKSEKFGILKIK